MRDVLGSVALAVAALLVGWLTNRSAKDTTKVNTMSAQTAELGRLATRVEDLEEDRDQARRRAREHEKWDRVMVRRLREAMPDEEFPDPPPLDT